MRARPRPGRGAGAPAATGLLGLYHPGASWLHRLGPGPKAAGLALVGLAVVLTRGPWWAAGLAVVVVAAAASARLPFGPTVRGLVPVLVVAVAVGGYQWWQRSWAVGLEVSLDLVTAVLAAAAVTATTPADRMLDAVVRAVRPLRRVGASPESVALAVALMVRAVPALARTSAEARDAARARGLGRSPRALLVPAAVRAVGRARTTGDALAARGLGD